MNPEFPGFKREINVFERGGNTTGSLQSFYETGVESQGSVKKARTSNHTAGPLPLFPNLDVMPGAASAVNEGYVENWGLQSMNKNLIDPRVLEQEEAIGEFKGWVQQPNVEFKEEDVTMSKETMGVFNILGSNVDFHAAQAPHGQHESDVNVAQQSEMQANEHNVGDEQEGRDAGLERSENPAINKGTGEEVYHNSETIDTTAPSGIPMDVDAIEVNGETVHPEDTAQVLGQHGG